MGKIITANVGAFKVNYGQWLANENFFGRKYFIAFYEINQFWENIEGLTTDQLYGKFHNACKEQLDFPYYFFNPSQFAKKESIGELNVKKKQTSPRLYLLLDRSMNDGVYSTLPVFEFNDIDYRPQTVQSLSTVDLHILVKLFLSYYFRHEKNLVYSSNEFWKVLEGDKICADEGFHCLHIKLSEGSKQINGIPTTAKFKRVIKDDLEEVQASNQYQKFYTFNEHDDWDDYLFELKPSVARYLLHHNFMDKTGKEIPVFIRYTQKREKANVSYLSIEGEEYTRHGVLYDFINDFRDYLIDEFGVVMEKKLISHDFEKVKGKGKRIKIINELHILDNRVQNKKRLVNQQVSSQRLHELTSNELMKVHPTGKCKLYSKRVKSRTKTPLLVLQDCEKSDFEKNRQGILQTYQDPKEGLYKNFPNTPKQTLSMNPNKRWNSKQKRFITDREYLTYDEAAIQNHLGKKGNELEVCLNQLTIKNILLNGVPITKEPVFDKDPILRKYIFVFDNLALWVNEKHQFEWMEALDKETKAYSKRFWKKIETFSNIDRHTIVKTALAQKSLPGKKPNNIFKNRYFMFGKDEFAEIALTNEYVLYDSPEIRARRKEMEKARPAGFFWLKLDNPPTLDKGRVASQREIYEYNTLLDTCFKRRDFSYRDLTSLKVKDVPEIDVEGKYVKKRLNSYIAQEIFKIGNLRSLQSFYKFASPKSTDVINLYDQFYLNEEEGLYCVGRPYGFEHDLDKALRIRKLLVHQGNMQVRDLLYSMDVFFVRHKQFTVYPYPFNFIKMIKGF